MSEAIFFGKLPAVGDFVARGLDAADRAAWDGWLSSSFADAAAALGDGFAVRFDRAPPWRFVRLGEAGWTAGAVAPSVDRVGRRFPAMVARTGLDADLAATAAADLEGLLYDAIAGAWDVDTLVEAAAAIALAPGSAAQRDRWWTLGGGDTDDVAFAPAECHGAWPDNLIEHMLSTAGCREGWTL